VVSGSSAGAAIMSDPMIGGGSSEGALAEGIRGRGEEGEGVILQKGLGLLGDPLVDQHFLARGRWARLLIAVLETEAYTYGAGIDENTALVVEGDSARVVGASGVVLFDTRASAASEEGRGFSGIVVYLLGSGDVVDLQSGSVRFHSQKASLLESEDPPDLSALDLFERWNLLRFLAGAAVSPEREFTFSQSGYDFRFQKREGFRAVEGEGEGVQGLPSGLALGPLVLSFTRVEGD